jgi:hypothetical protein
MEENVNINRNRINWRGGRRKEEEKLKKEKI